MLDLTFSFAGRYFVHFRFPKAFLVWLVPPVKVMISAGGMEDSAHHGTFGSELIVFSDSLYRLQYLDVNASLFHKLQRSSWNLVEDTGTLRDPNPNWDQ